VSEGKVYRCKWKQQPNGDYHVWLVGRPSISTVQSSVADAAEVLVSEICGQLGDGEAMLDFDPPLPADERLARFFADDLVNISTNGSFHLFNPLDQIFSGGRCAACGGALGERTEVPFELNMGNDADVALLYEPEFAHLLVASESFLSRLSKADLDQFETRPTVWPRHRKKFFELRPRSFVPNCGIRGEASGGWECWKCDRRVLSYANLFDFGPNPVCRSDLPERRDTVFFVGTPANHEIYVSRKRWDKLRGGTGMRSLTATKLPVVAASQCDRKLKLRNIDDINRANIRRGVSVDRELMHRRRPPRPK
jgi:hypothetical protein